MTHISFDPDKINWTKFLELQEGGSSYFVGSKYQRGFGGYQRGGGIGDVLGSIARFLAPVAKNIATSVGEQGLAAGAQVLKDVSEGKDFKSSVTTHGRKGIENISAKVRQCGKGGKKPQKRTNNSLKARPIQKRKKRNVNIEALRFL